MLEGLSVLTVGTCFDTCGRLISCDDVLEGDLCCGLEVLSLSHSRSRSMCFDTHSFRAAGAAHLSLSKRAARLCHWRRRQPWARVLVSNLGTVFPSFKSARDKICVLIANALPGPLNLPADCCEMSPISAKGVPPAHVERTPGSASRQLPGSPPKSGAGNC